MDLAIKHGLYAATIAFFVGGWFHWASGRLFGQLHRLLAYVAGVVIIGMVFTGWAVSLRYNLDTLIVCGIWWLIVAGVGLGIGGAYLIDHLGGMCRELHWLQRRANDGAE